LRFLDDDLITQRTSCRVCVRWEFENDVFDRALARAQAWHIGLAASAAAAAQPTVSNARTTNDTGGAPRPSALDMWSSHGPYSPFMHTLVPGSESTSSYKARALKAYLLIFPHG